MRWCTDSLTGALREPRATPRAGPGGPATDGRRGGSAPGPRGVREPRDAEGASGVPAPLVADAAAERVPEFIEIMIGADADVLGGAVTPTATDTGGAGASPA